MESGIVSQLKLIWVPKRSIQQIVHIHIKVCVTCPKTGMGFLRYICHLFESGKHQEIQIGYPTDVKHVAHIGWDGPSVNTPSWMKEFKSSGLSLNGDTTNAQTNNSVKRAPEDTCRKRSTNTAKKRELPDLPQTSASRRQSTGSSTESSAKERPEKTKQPRKSSKPKNPSDGSKSNPVTMDLILSDSPTRTPPHIPKKARRKKSKEDKGPSRLRLKAQAMDQHSDPGSSSNSKSFDDDDDDGVRKSLMD